jgi:ABC-type polysaccharide/polyol phosphate transport system ATPase subunit
MTDKTVVSIDNVSKRFRIYQERTDTLKELLLFRRRKYEELWAVRDVSFDVPAGQTLGIIGQNGSGKSTLLKLLSGILRADKGSVTIDGKISALLELGAGFHPDLTGRENVYLNGAILRLSRKQIDAVFDDIVAFSELEEFIDQPVKNYSSGMYTRLGFAVAINVNPDILLVDEVLAVGDQHFQSKCYEKINDLQYQGKTIIFVSHDLDAVRKVCDRAIYMENGVILEDGAAAKVIGAYRSAIADRDLEYVEGREGRERDRIGTHEAEITKIELINSKGQNTLGLDSKEKTTIRLTVEFRAEVLDPIFGLTIDTPDGKTVYGTNTLWRGVKTGLFKKGQTLTVDFVQEMRLAGGDYAISPAVAYSDATKYLDWRTNVVTFMVRDDGTMMGTANLDSALTIVDGQSGKTILSC